MKKDDLAAIRRQNTIAELVDSMHSAQRKARMNTRRKPRRRAYVEPRPSQIGVWKGGC